MFQNSKILNKTARLWREQRPMIKLYASLFPLCKNGVQWQEHPWRDYMLGPSVCAVQFETWISWLGINEKAGQTRDQNKKHLAKLLKGSEWKCQMRATSPSKPPHNWNWGQQNDQLHRLCCYSWFYKLQLTGLDITGELDMVTFVVNKVSAGVPSDI